MRPPCIGEREVMGQRGAGLADTVVSAQVNLLVFHRSPQPLDENVVPPGAAPIHANRDPVLQQQPRERGDAQAIHRFAATRSSEPTDAVILLSVLKISGQPNRAKASCTASTQNPTSIVFDTRQASTLRVAQSITATRYRKPRRIGIYVMSAHQTWFGRSTAKSRSRYG